jgi:opacity protein-like surface antigen
VKKVIGILVLSLLSGGSARGSEILLELKAGYFRPSKQLFRTVYGGGLKLTGEVTLPVWKHMDVFVSAGYSSQGGELTITGEETRLRMVPIEAGIKYRLLKGSPFLYVGAGLAFHHYQESSSIGDVSGNALGLVLKAGITIPMTNRWTVDLHLNGSYCTANPTDSDINIGGLSAGIGVGYRF